MIWRPGSTSPLRSMAVASSNSTISLFSATLRSMNQISSRKCSPGSAVGFPSAKFAASRYFTSVCRRMILAPTRSSYSWHMTPMRPSPLPTRSRGAGCWSPVWANPVASIGPAPYCWPCHQITPACRCWWNHNWSAPMLVASSSYTVTRPPGSSC
ncbi:hypothetical protein G6F50_016431 [Rhizopus delemar]|uniref:Uncharacterized protein n=1 Tax=Rhizopus delemar TaxID=936053 RepID=A0A9P6XT17_9FUNG|nr:hypothetical protein G6F50_016431 [Rhizopus delemar]